MIRLLFFTVLFNLNQISLALTLKNESAVTYTRLYIWEYGTDLAIHLDKHTITEKNLLENPLAPKNDLLLNGWMSKGKTYDLLLIDTSEYLDKGIYKIVMKYSITMDNPDLIITDEEIIEDHSFDPTFVKFRGTSYFRITIENKGNSRLVYFEGSVDDSNFYKMKNFYRWHPIQPNTIKSYSEYGYVPNSIKMYINYTIEKNGQLEHKQAKVYIKHENSLILELINDTLEVKVFQNNSDNAGAGY